MNNTYEQHEHNTDHKIIFTIRKQVPFGKALYVCGSILELGNWEPQHALKLRWTQGDNWTGTLQLQKEIPKDFEFKYIVADWEHPSSTSSQWEIGSFNRKIDLSPSKKIVLCDDRWNMEKINLHLYVEGNSQDRYYIVGNSNELGVWKDLKTMKKTYERSSSSQRKENINQKAVNTPETKNIYTYSFYTFRLTEEIRYYYIRKGQAIESQRKPGRIFRFTNQKMAHPYRRGVTHEKGEINIHDNCRLNDLKISQITPQIYVGGYPKCASDIEKLKQQKISAIFSIQSQKDYKSHGLSPYYFRLLCQQHGIKLRIYSIEDMNNEDFVRKAEGGLSIFNQLINQGLKVYIHCSAGIYRSPQMIVLYLTLCEQYSLEDALHVVRSNHPFAKPDSTVIRKTIGEIKNKNDRRSRMYV